MTVGVKTSQSFAIKSIFFVILFLAMANPVKAQFIKEKSIIAQIGYGLSAPNNSRDEIVSGGLFLQGELNLKLTNWVELRPYLGLVITNSDGKDLFDNPTDELAETKTVLLGGKIRLRVPIPWVAPYLELGVGSSIGSFRTLTAFDSIEKHGIIYHTPFSIGLELGRNHNFDLGLSYYYQPSVKQYAGAFAIGITFPLSKTSGKIL